MKILVLISITWLSCNTKDVHVINNEIEKSLNLDSAFTFLNLSYGSDGLNKLDLYLPAGRNINTPIAVLLHGGGWVQGDKSGISGRAEQLMSRGYIVANLNYRFITASINYRGILNDLDSAFSFLKNNKIKYGIHQDKFHLNGYSAGGHIALLYAFNHNPSAINTVISFSGPTNINDAYFKKLIDTAWISSFIPGWLLGEPFALNSKTAIDCSPIYHIKNIPVLFIHGTLDDTVPYAQATALNDSLNAKNIKHLFISVIDGTHTSYGPRSTFYLDSIIRTADKWAFQ